MNLNIHLNLFSLNPSTVDDDHLSRNDDYDHLLSMMSHLMRVKLKTSAAYLQSLVHELEVHNSKDPLLIQKVTQINGNKSIPTWFSSGGFGKISRRKFWWYFGWRSAI